ncbi:HET-domain-containing protein [Apiospora arundinis]
MEGFSDLSSFQAETTRLKRALTTEIEGAYVNEELFDVVVPKAQIEEYARLGCKWWSMVESHAKALPEETPASETILDEDGGGDNGEQQRRKRDSNSVRVRLTRMIPFDLQWRMISHRVDVSTPGGDDTGYQLLMVIGRPDNVRRGTEHLASPINIQPGSASSFALIKHWLRYCINSHDCGIMDAPPAMPRILLDVKSSSLDNNNGRVRIVETGSHLCAPYVALSYCWGPQGQKVFLTKQTKSRFLKGIEVEKVDTSIQDAMKVTRELGFQYLWIDALCIVQDDDVDKAHDIAHMHNIYRNAAFTIVASRSATVTEGFLFDRKAAGADTPDIIFSLDGDGAGAGAGADYTQPSNNVTAIPRQDGIDEPWGHRAWTFQESLSSGRCLVFGGVQTHWNCQRGEVPYKECDGWFQYQQDTASVTDDRRTFRQVTDIMNGKDTGLDRQGLLFVWQELIISYAERVISFHRDRLPAVSSIAQAFAKVLKDDYICGHWRSNLHADLLWKSMFHRQKIPDAISWSWASSYGPMWRDWYPGRLVADADFRVLGFRPTYVSDEDPHGAVHSAS